MFDFKGVVEFQKVLRSRKEALLIEARPYIDILTSFKEASGDDENETNE